jgi:hypothetical protein
MSDYKREQIIEFTNGLAADIQKHINSTIKMQNTKEISNLTKVLNDLTTEKPQELPLVIKLHSETESVFTTENVNFG